MISLPSKVVVNSVARKFSNVNLYALPSEHHFDPPVLDVLQVPGSGLQYRTDFLVSVRGFMMKKHQPFDMPGRREIRGQTEGRMPPVLLLNRLAERVLRIDDQAVSAFEIRFVLWSPVEILWVQFGISRVYGFFAVFFYRVAVATAGMAHQPVSDPNLSDIHPGSIEMYEFLFRSHGVEADRKIRLFHLPLEDALEVRIGTVHGQLRARIERRSEKRQPLDMVPVKMGEEQVDRCSLLRCDYFLPEVADSRARVEYKTAWFIGLYLDACGVSPYGRKEVVGQAREEQFP